MKAPKPSVFEVLVVDDFEPDVEVISGLVRSCRDIGVELAGACRNGSEALEYIESAEPDIVITDIEMPHMGGVELARSLALTHPRIKVVFCTLHDEFEYARQALYLHNYGYILKPPDPAEFRKCIESVTGRITTESSQQEEYARLRDLVERNRPVLIEALVKELLFGLLRDERVVWERIAYLGGSFAKGTYTVVLVETDDFDRIAADFTIEQRHVLSLKVANSVAELATGPLCCLLARIDESHIGLLVGQRTTSRQAQYRAALDDLCSRILARFGKSDISVSVAVSGPAKRLGELSGLYQQSTYLIRHKFTLGKGKAIFPDDIPHSDSVGSVDYNALQKDFRFLLSSGSAGALAARIDRLLSDESETESPDRLKDTALFLLMCAQTLLLENREDLSQVPGMGANPWERILAIETGSELLRWVGDTLEGVRAHVQQAASTKNRFVVEMVKKHIALNYATNAGLKAIAPELSYSPNYLNLIFRQSTGETIFEYTTRLRMEKARELLDDPSLKIHEVAEAVGYSHSAYFTNVFRKHVGVTPREYRERRVP